MRGLKIIPIISLLITFGANSQVQNEPCAFDWTGKTKIHPSVEKIIYEGAQEIAQNKTSHPVNTIPVVVHIIHTGGSENISDLQVQSQIDIMNEDYGKLAGTPGDGNGVDTDMRFCLAKIDPNGNCTNGIVRVYSTLTNHSTIDRPLLKQLSFWDNEMYMNIYVVKNITGGVLGYSSFPGGPAAEDGIVVRHSVFGNIGTASSSMGRTMAHEIGHWFGVYHTFSGGCGIDECTDGDFVCDTPPVGAANFGCPTGVNSCSNDNPDLPDLIDNYMDYSNDVCKSMFTQGQADRMLSTLINIRTNISSPSNIVATGCDTGYVAPPTCPVVANYVTLNSDICIGNSINFMDISLNDATSWAWTFTGGTPATSIMENPTIAYNTIGAFDVKLVVSDGISSDSITMTDYVTVSNPGVGDPIPFLENFENGFPANGLSLYNADGLGTWMLDSIAPYEGDYCIRIDNYNNPCCGSIDEVYFPFFDFSSLGATPYMKFAWAYAKSDVLYSDEMIVQLSTDCGNNWNQVFYRTGTTLVTGPTQTTSFVPDSTQWKFASINLGAYASEQYVLLRIVNVPDGGNNLYIDDVKIGDINVGIEENNTTESNLIVYPNPSSSNVTVKMNKINSGTFKLITITGQVVESYNFSETNKLNINVSNYPAGFYQTQIITDESSFSTPLVIRR